MFSIQKFMCIITSAAFNKYYRRTNNISYLAKLKTKFNIIIKIKKQKSFQLCYQRKLRFSIGTATYEKICVSEVNLIVSNCELNKYVSILKHLYLYRQQEMEICGVWGESFWLYYTEVENHRKKNSDYMRSFSHNKSPNNKYYHKNINVKKICPSKHRVLFYFVIKLKETNEYGYHITSELSGTTYLNHEAI